ncbi:hypothetical protein ACHAPU_010826 [Fusarium lateritium]
MPNLERILNACWRTDYPPEFDVPDRLTDEDFAELDKIEPSLEGWGFTVYRTYYGPGSDENWNTLLAKARDLAGKELEFWASDGEDELVEELRTLFRVDARSDSAVLDGQSLEELCKTYLDSVGGKPMAVHEWNVFLVADKHVLDQIGQGNFIIKAVDADRPPQNEDPVRTGTNKLSWGWHRMEVRQMLEFWGMLEICATHHCMCWAVHQAELDNMIWEGCDAD